MKPEELTHIITEKKDRLYRFAYRFLASTAEAEDVVQEVFIKLWAKKNDLWKVQNLDAWCMTLTRNLSLDKLRNKHQKTVALETGSEVHAASLNPDRQTELNDSIRHVHRILNNLPENQRAAIHLRDIEGLSYQEITEVLQATPEQVKTWIFRGRQKIKSEFQKAESYGL